MTQEERQNRKVATAGVFSRAALTYDTYGPRFFSLFGRELVERAHITPGTKVLDVATGRGAVLFPAAEKIGTSGYVTGIDIAGAMVAHTNSEIAYRKLPNVRVAEMDAEYLGDFESDAFDIVLCGFGLFFFPNLPAALQEFFRVLKPGGWLGATSWGAIDPKWSWISEVGLRPHPRSADQTCANARPAGMHDGTWWQTLQAQLEGIGFVNHRREYEERELAFADANDWWQSEWSHGGRAHLEKMTPEQLEDAKNRAFDHLAQMEAMHGAITSVYGVNYTFAQKPH
jgi:ubiquinone/menaquinone biosynthesis C-methylase UbiE